uniref:long-chain-alcohol O-fatty-acyltransferase n=1 Tax=Brassica oleracea var. oleracea TaxID=109376 RepID=A0A0D3EBB1_BRAOL
MVPATLRRAIYYPVRKITKSKMNSDQVLFLGVATFIVSGAVHELIFFYFTRERPTREVTLFFVLHGVFTAAGGAVCSRDSLTKSCRPVTLSSTRFIVLLVNLPNL